MVKYSTDVLRNAVAASVTMADVLRHLDGAVIAYALAHPGLGPKAVARQLRELDNDDCLVSHGTMSNILREAGLNTIAARRAAASAGSF